MSTDNEKLNSKDLSSKIEKENSICDKICNVGTFICYSFLVSLLIFLSLDLFYYIGFIIYDKTGSTELAEGVGIILAACISITGVLLGFRFNRKQTYKEIVTRERIEWLHKMQEALAEFLSITSKDDFADEDEYKIYRARELYYLIISNLNVKEEDGKENERDAVEFLYNYARSRGLDVELNFDRNVDSDEKKDSNVTKSIDDLKKENEKLTKKINTLEATIKILRKTEEADPLAGLKRKEIISQYTEIFNETWNRIKNEAD